jgi:hypothetical protein
LGDKSPRTQVALRQVRRSRRPHHAVRTFPATARPFLGGDERSHPERLLPSPSSLRSPNWPSGLRHALRQTPCSSVLPTSAAVASRRTHRGIPRANPAIGHPYARPRECLPDSLGWSPRSTATNLCAASVREITEPTPSTVAREDIQGRAVKALGRSLSSEDF